MRPQLVVAAVVLALSFAADVHPAAAHQSEFETLTVDLLLNGRGIVTIDAAINVVAGPSYEPYPSDELRRETAAALMRAMGIAATDVRLEPGGNRYHEIGFSIWPPAPFANAPNGTVRFDTSALQRIAADHGLKHLKLSVCDADGDTYSAKGVQIDPPTVLIATASSEGRLSPRSRSDERYGCRVWELTPAGAPVTISARVGPRTLAATGTGLSLLQLAIALMAGGALLLGIARRRDGTRSLRRSTSAAL